MFRFGQPRSQPSEKRDVLSEAFDVKIGDRSSRLADGTQIVLGRGANLPTGITTHHLALK